MKHTKRWVSLLLAVMMTVAAPLSAFAAWEDGFVIPRQNSGSNSYDDLFWDTTNKSDSTTISSSITEDKKKEDTTEKEDTGSKKSDEKTADAVLYWQITTQKSMGRILYQRHVLLQARDRMIICRQMAVM